jgi:large subunit ribosomal protein L24
MDAKIHKGDTVEVITGKAEDKGKRGEVIRVIPKEHRLVVQGINVHTKHKKQVQSQGQTIKPGKVRFEMPIDSSNVMLVCKKCNKPTRVGLSREEGRTRRICKECGSAIDS